MALNDQLNSILDVFSRRQLPRGQGYRPDEISERLRNPGHPMDFGDLLKWRRAFRTGVALPSSPDNVLNYNSLQVRHAERYVFSSQPDPNSSSR